MKQEHVIEINDFSKEELIEILEFSEKIEDNPKLFEKKLDGRSVAALFFEPSTRTKDSFTSATQWMGGKVVGFDSPGGLVLINLFKLS